MNFFKAHPPQGVGWTDVPAYIQYEARKYFMDEAGMTIHQANMWMREK